MTPKSLRAMSSSSDQSGYFKNIMTPKVPGLLNHNDQRFNNMPAVFLSVDVDGP